jgi:hypothetical protein
MRKRKLLWTQVALTLAFVVFVAWPRTSRVTRENYDRIQLGMSRAEVKAILGAPPGDYANGPTDRNDDLYLTESIDPKIWRRRQIVISGDIWYGDTAEIWVNFQLNDIAVEKHFWPRARQQQSALRDYGWRVRRCWDWWFPD